MKHAPRLCLITTLALASACGDETGPFPIRYETEHLRIGLPMGEALCEGDLAAYERDALRHVHFVAIGGTGMGSLAGLLKARGWFALVLRFTIHSFSNFLRAQSLKLWWLSSFLPTTTQVSAWVHIKPPVLI